MYTRSGLMSCLFSLVFALKVSGCSSALIGIVGESCSLIWVRACITEGSSSREAQLPRSEAPSNRNIMLHFWRR